MDKATRALSLAEDHALEIESLSAKLTDRLRYVTIAGYGTAKGMSFGNVTSYGGVAIVAYDDSGQSELRFCGNVIAWGASPIFVMLPPGTGELLLCANRSNARAVVIGGRPEVQT